MEDTDLESITGIGPAVARDLRDEGIKDLHDLADADPDDINIPTGNTKTIIERAKQSTISSQTAGDLLEEYETQVLLETGVGNLDDILGGGLEPETIGLLYGKSGTGKTQVALRCLVEAAKSGTSVYLQTEMQSKGVGKRIRDFAEDEETLKNIEIYEAYDVEDQFSSYQAIFEKHDDISLLVVDSFTAQFRTEEKFAGRNNLGDRSDAISKHLKSLGEWSRETGVPILLVGQVYSTPEAYGKGDVPWGGEKMKHFVSYFLRTTNGKGELNKIALENHAGRTEEEQRIYIHGDGIEDK